MLRGCLQMPMRMRMHTCADSRACVCVCACTRACARACTSTCMWTGARARAHAHVHAHAHACLLHDRCRRAASSRWTRLPPTRAATPPLPSRQHPHARTCMHTHDCGLALALPGCDLVAPTPRVGETRPHLDVHMHLHAVRASSVRLLRYLRSRPNGRDRGRRR